MALSCIEETMFLPRPQVCALPHESAVIAAAFAATTVTAFAQATKDVKAKDGNVKSPDGKAVVTKDAKEAPKAAPAPAVTPKAKEPVKAGEVKTKDGAPVKGADKKDVKTETKTK